MNQSYFLGKRPYVDDPRSLELSHYIDYRSLPPMPDEVRWYAAHEPNKWGMMGNDKYGLCVIATAAHILMAAWANASDYMGIIEDDSCIELARKMNALNGYIVLDRLKFWRKNFMFGTQIAAFCNVAIRPPLMRAATYMFGHLDIGLSMPLAWQNTDVWTVGDGPSYRYGSWGGHSVPILGYRKLAGNSCLYYACTWGKIVTITEEALYKYCDEAWVSIVPDWYKDDNFTPSGFDYKTLMADLAKL